jgi:hypothetical protein
MMKAIHPLKRRSLQESHGVTSYKTAFFIFAATIATAAVYVKTNSLTNYTDCPFAAGRRILVLTFEDMRVLRGQRGGSARPLISVF